VSINSVPETKSLKNGKPIPSQADYNRNIRFYHKPSPCHNRWLQREIYHSSIHDRSS